MITFETVENEAEKTNTNPSDAQKSAGNYKMGHISVKGMKIAIENPRGSKRYYGNEGKYNVMKHHYGYFNITKGKDGDAVDVFLGPDIENFDKVYCVDQNKEDGEFDETKVMLGFNSKEEAKEAYLSNYSPDWTGFRDITSVSVKDFKKWLYRGRKQRQPFADYVYIQKKKLDEMRELTNYKQIDLDSIAEPLSECDLFDYGNANYYFTTEEPLANNAATLEEFFTRIKQSNQRITWDFDWSYGGGQAFGTRNDGMEIQLDAAGNGDFVSHIITVTVTKDKQLKEKKMKKVIKLNESDITNIIMNSVKRALNEAYSTDDIADMLGADDSHDGPTNEGPDWDEQVYYEALRIMRKFDFGDDVSIDALEHTMYDYLDGAYKSEKIMSMSPADAGLEMAKEAMRRVDSEYYDEEIEPLLSEKRVIKLSENDLHEMVKNVLNEVFDGEEPTQKDWDDFAFWASSDEPDLVNDEIGAAHDKEEGFLIDADDEGEGYSRDYMAGTEYAKNLIAKSRVPEGMVEELNEKEDNGTISAFELGILDTLDEG